MKNVIVDSNVFGVLFRKEGPDYFQKFQNLLSEELVDEYRICSTQFGILEKIGIEIPKLNLSIPKKIPDGVYHPQSEKIFGKKTCDALSYLRTEATKHYEKYVSEEVLKSRYQEQVQKHWKNSTVSNEWLERLLPTRNHYKSIAHDLLELLSVDYQHGYAHFPKEMQASALSMAVMAMFVEYVGVPPETPRNVVLGRLFKKMWLDRIKSGDKAPKEEVEKFHKAMKFRCGEDFVDLEISYFTLFGYFLNGAYQPTYSITSDPLDTIKRRLFVVKEIVKSLNKEVFPHLVSPPIGMRYVGGKILVVDKELNHLDTISPDSITNDLYLSK